MAEGWQPELAEGWEQNGFWSENIFQQTVAAVGNAPKEPRMGNDLFYSRNQKECGSDELAK